MEDGRGVWLRKGGHDILSEGHPLSKLARTRPCKRSRRNFEKICKVVVTEPKPFHIQVE